jgi:peptide/nickel transport system permease protein
MAAYLMKRLIQSIFVLFGITVVVFVVLHLSGDPVQLMVPPSASQADIEALRIKMGFNDPIYQQYLRFLANIFHGDFGESYYYNEPAMKIVLERFPATVELSLCAMIIALIVSIPAGIISAVKRNSISDGIIRLFALLGQCVPSFWLGILFILLFSVTLHLLPTGGNKEASSIILPAVTLGTFSAASITRVLRSSMIEVLGKEFITVAIAKGLPYKMVIMKHAFKNAFSGMMTIIGMQFAGLLGGSVIIETVFAWPGVGRLIVQSITNNDFMVVEATVILLASIFVLINFIVDVLYCVINPRVKMQ